MRLFITLVGIVLMLFGIFSYGYQNITYNKQEEIARFGDLKLTASTQESVYFPPLVSGLAFVGGIVLVIVGQVGSGQNKP